MFFPFPMLHTPFFSPKFLADAAKASSQELADLQEHALPIVREWQESLRSGALAATKEEQLQTDFLEAFFAKMLGYESSRGAAVWNLEKEQKNVTDSQKADGALGFFSMKDGQRQSDIRAVVELKGAKSDLDKPQNRKEDKRSPVEQAFAYGSKTGGKCRWVIVSNVVEIRLYHVTDQSRYERFELKTLHESEQLRRFLFLLHRARLLNATNPNEKSELEALHEQRKEQERTISAEFYGKYKAARIQLVEHLKAHNPSHDELLLLQKAQKLLDRLLFVFFCEDLNLLPRQTAYKVIQNAKQSFSAAEGEIWRQLKGLFTAIDKGNPPNNISKFNGGLFAPDAEMDALTVGDGMIESLLQFSEYDFDSDLNVRILGHIFEQSVSDIEELKATITGTAHDTKTGKRKRDGIFYTPEYITRFIVQSTVGAYLEERKQECGFGALSELTDDDFASISISKGVLKANKRIEQHIAAWNAYREHVRTVRVCDPACGSGAFLIEVFDFLYAEGQRVNAELSRLRGGQTEVFDLEKHILTRNIFGVDVNAEAVEITKLSLWLKTANKGKELTDLDGNIKCGNSLVDDPRVAGEAAFDWSVQFASVMEQGGFDVIVGNPPYVKLQNLKAAGAAQIDYLVQQYFSAQTGNFDLYLPFIERGIGLLNASGSLGFIAPSMWIYSEYGKNLRALVSENHLLATFLDFGSFQVFDDATVYTACQFFSKKTKETISFAKIASADIESAQWSRINYSSLTSDTWALDSGEKLAIKRKMDVVGKPLVEVCDKIFVGIQTSADVIYHLEKLGRGRYFSEQLGTEVEIEDDVMKPLVTGTDVKRYVYPGVSKHLLFPYKITTTGAELYTAQEMEHSYPSAWKYLQANEVFLRQREKGKMNHAGWYGYNYPKNLDKQQLPKIGVAQTVSRLQMFLDEKGEFYFNNVRVNAIAVSEHFESRCLLALLNSRLVDFYFRLIAKPKDNGFYEANKQFIAPLPLPVLSSEEQQPFITHTETMLTTTRSLSDLRKRVLTLLLTKTGIQKPSTKLQEWDALTWAELEAEFRKAKVKVSLNDQEELLQYFEQKKAEAERLKTVLATTDRAIDTLVYELYGLTAEEIAVVEGKE